MARHSRGRKSTVDDAQPVAPDVAHHVLQLLSALLADGGRSPGIRLVSERMGMAVRTLQRRLHASGTTYAGVMQQARCMAAGRLLRDRRRRIGEIARTLGYSDHPHFTRAFQRWTGLTPRDFRRRGGRRPATRTRRP